MIILILISIFIVPIAIILGLHFLSNAVGRKMRVVLHKENEPAMYIGEENNICSPTRNIDMIGRAGAIFTDD
jgi:hypothetical protein